MFSRKNIRNVPKNKHFLYFVNLLPLVQEFLNWSLCSFKLSVDKIQKFHGVPLKMLVQQQHLFFFHNKKALNLNGKGPDKPETKFSGPC